MRLFDKLFRNRLAKKQSEKAVNDLISGLPPLTPEQQKEFEEMLEKEKNAPPTEIVRETLDIGETISEYIFNDILVIDEKKNALKRYLIESENQGVVRKDVQALLKILNNTIKSNNLAIDFEIDTSLSFSHKNYGNKIDFAFLKYSPLTDKGKNAKYPIELHIQNKKNEFGTAKENLINGEIFYMQNGEIGKSRLYVWHNSACYTFNFAIKNKILQVTKIEKTSNIVEYSKDILYKLEK